MPKGTLEIVEFDPRRPEPAVPECNPVLPENSISRDLLGRLRGRYRAATSVAVALAVAVLHALVLAPMLWGGTSKALAKRYGSPTPVQAVVIEDRSATTVSPPTLSAPVMQAMPVDLPDVPNHTARDPGLAALYGRYLGQIHARIDRAWLRPRSAIGAPMFRCQVEVWQQRDGAVQTITLQRCNGTLPWQRSLVEGIAAASPLPAPPKPAVFAHRVILHFRAVSYRPGRPADEYESAPAAPRGTNSDSSGIQGLRSSLRQAGRPNGPVVIQLRLDGSHMEVQPQRH